MDQELTRACRLDAELEAGTRNLLLNCVGLAKGQRVLIVGEDHDASFFDPGVCGVVAEAVRRLGGRPQVVMTPATTGPEDFPADIAGKMRDVDHTVFFSRLGDQVRFCPLPGSGSKTMCYVHEETYLRDAFAHVTYGLFRDVNEQLLDELAKKQTCHITCPLGTDLKGDVLAMSQNAGGGLTDNFSVAMFPIMIIPPLSARGLTGRLAPGRWLMTTSTRNYQGSLVELTSLVVADIEDGRIARFDGGLDEVRRVEDHFKRVAGISGGDPYAVNSWHAGTNPKTFYNGRAEDNIEKWSDLVFGSPRYTHFHTCGNDPGDIAVSLIDATVKFDGDAYWDAGRFAFLDTPRAIQIRDRYPGCNNAFEMRWDIGV